MSSPEVSVLTAAHNPNPRYLNEAYDSLQQQSIDMQWIIQIDGTDEDIMTIPEAIRDDSRVDIKANGERLGVAATRMLALVRCESELIQNLDADDTFFPEAIPQLIEAIESRDVAFAFGQSHLIYPDGREEHWQPSPWPAGIIAPGDIPNRWLETGRHHVSLSATLWKLLYIYKLTEAGVPYAPCKTSI